MSSVKLNKMIEKLQLVNLVPEVSTDEIEISSPEINRPALQLAGYFEHFASERVQIIGYVEYTYLKSLDRDVKLANYEQFLSSDIPCVIYSTRTEPDEDMIELAKKYHKPLLSSHRITSDLMAEVIRWLGVELAPCISIHGVLMDVYGEGILIMGESGIGKSEAALELIKRGHRLITDDVVEIHKVSDDTLVGTSPEITRHFIELRGIGVIDVRQLFGMRAVMPESQIDLVVEFEQWDSTKFYDRLGIEDRFIDILEQQVACVTVPIRPGRNLASIVEVAAMNNRHRRYGYNAAEELARRVDLRADMGSQATQEKQ